MEENNLENAQNCVKFDKLDSCKLRLRGGGVPPNPGAMYYGSPLLMNCQQPVPLSLQGPQYPYACYPSLVCTPQFPLERWCNSPIIIFTLPETLKHMLYPNEETGESSSSDPDWTESNSTDSSSHPKTTIICNKKSSSPPVTTHAKTSASHSHKPNPNHSKNQTQKNNKKSPEKKITITKEGVEITYGLEDISESSSCPSSPQPCRAPGSPSKTPPCSQPPSPAKTPHHSKTAKNKMMWCPKYYSSPKEHHKDVRIECDALSPIKNQADRSDDFPSHLFYDIPDNNEQADRSEHTPNYSRMHCDTSSEPDSNDLQEAVPTNKGTEVVVDGDKVKICDNKGDLKIEFSDPPEGISSLLSLSVITFSESDSATGQPHHSQKSELSGMSHHIENSCQQSSEEKRHSAPPGPCPTPEKQQQRRYSAPPRHPLNKKDINKLRAQAVFVAAMDAADKAAANAMECIKKQFTQNKVIQNGKPPKCLESSPAEQDEAVTKAVTEAAINAAVQAAGAAATEAIKDAIEDVKQEKEAKNKMMWSPKYYSSPKEHHKTVIRVECDALSPIQNQTDRSEGFPSHLFYDIPDHSKQADHSRHTPNYTKIHCNTSSEPDSNDLLQESVPTNKRTKGVVNGDKVKICDNKRGLLEEESIDFLDGVSSFISLSAITFGDSDLEPKQPHRNKKSSSNTPEEQRCPQDVLQRQKDGDKVKICGNKRGLLEEESIDFLDGVSSFISLSAITFGDSDLEPKQPRRNKKSSSNTPEEQRCPQDVLQKQKDGDKVKICGNKRGLLEEESIDFLDGVSNFISLSAITFSDSDLEPKQPHRNKKSSSNTPEEQRCPDDVLERLKASLINNIIGNNSIKKQIVSKMHRNKETDNDPFVQKIIIPKGMIDPNETTIIEIPGYLKRVPVVVARKDEQDQRSGLPAEHWRTF